jgi:hypothetical protein
LTTAECSCGFTEQEDETLIDHLHKVFTPDDMTSGDGLVHVESVAQKCLCGFTATTPEGLDEHFLEVFTPDDFIGHDGKEHRTPCT